MSWICLIAAIIFETLGTTFLKMSHGFSVFLPSVGATASYVACFVLLSFALKTIDISVGYAIWCAGGILLVSAIGMLFFHESAGLVKMLSILLIIAGTVGLKMAK